MHLCTLRSARFPFTRAGLVFLHEYCYIAPPSRRIHTSAVPSCPHGLFCFISCHTRTSSVTCSCCAEGPCRVRLSSTSSPWPSGTLGVSELGQRALWYSTSFCGFPEFIFFVPLPNDLCSLELNLCARWRIWKKRKNTCWLCCAWYKAASKCWWA